MHYASMLREHIAREALIAGQFEIRRPRKPDTSKWQKFQDGEPIADAPEACQLAAYRRINRSFVEPRLQKLPDAECSMLIYGPPGTGKTTVVEEIADALGYRLITITASDFLAAGAADIEARAKAIFEALQQQWDTVVLFDEMDHFLLDRESKLYRDQDSSFQLMTPGMLTKINNLRAKNRCIFVIATNFAERIDPAIKRPGRIDQQILLLPPNHSRRKKILKERLDKHCEDLGQPVALLTDRQLAAAAKMTRLMTWKELDNLCRDVVREARQAGTSLASVLNGRRITPFISVRGYRNRFVQQQQNGAELATTEGRPFEEFGAIAYLSDEQDTIPDVRAYTKARWRKIFEKDLGVAGAVAQRLAGDAKKEMST
jgi:hypothetical protein